MICKTITLIWTNVNVWWLFFRHNQIKKGGAISRMALDLLKSAKTILKTDELTIDNGVFKLHYRATLALLVGSSLIGVAKQYFGDPINCQVRLYCAGINGDNQTIPPDCLRCEQQGAGWLLLDSLNLSCQDRVPGEEENLITQRCSGLLNPSGSTIFGSVTC